MKFIFFERNSILPNLIEILWHAANIFIFVWFFLKYHHGDEWFYLRKIVGPYLALARAPAAVLNFNCCLVLLPVCRNLLVFLRYVSGCSRRIKALFDHNIKMHKKCAYMIALMTFVHLLAHLFNVKLLTESHESTDPLIQALNKLEDPYLNPIRSSDVDLIISVFVLFGGWTGVIITVALIVIITAATETIRRSFFEIFWYCHHLFVIFYAFLLIHGLKKQIRGQTNLDEHNPQNCSLVPEEWSDNSVDCPTPLFAGSDPGTWKWVIGPVLLYFFERIIRLSRSLNPAQVVKVIFHPSRVIEIQMHRQRWCFGKNKNEVGEYVFLNCRELAFLEWHPFTLTSAPEEDFLSVHIRSAGDWTNNLYDLFSKRLESGDITNAPRIAIDGPFGAASQDVFDYEISICVGAGIGITPFGSLLKSVYYKKANGIPMKLEKIYLIWICPTYNSFEWFSDLVAKLTEKLESIDQLDVLDLRIYLSRGWDDKFARKILMEQEEESEFDPVTGLRQKTNYGRPDWSKLFSEFSKKHHGRTNGVFVCGPKVISTQLRENCTKYTDGSTNFVFNKENF